ncbi:MAG: DUF2834 domain-containing protein [Mitsuaria chitosanitabida]|uniref:DUF2834 domain-containing protein n=1 Tax=Roseateles chitosanitabidus TaxID=65048 RepID=UPI001B0E857A|nr:DUF2834 domain-containing protein [Roseateles chitosanitabidus]MBO9688996.1 DUF2834 domain-containing protein [Roseateles chitosanitabidus]
MLKILLALVLAAFGAYSMVVMFELGYLGLWKALLAGPASRQALADLMIASVLLLGFLWRDARQHGRRFWPYALITLAAGSFGPLLYLLLAPKPAATPADSATRPLQASPSKS